MTNTQRALLTGVAVLVLSGLLFGSRDTHRPVVITQVQALSDLVTVKYVMEQVVVQEKGAFLGNDRVLLVAHGIVKAGVDLKKMSQADIVVNKNEISLHLPAAEVTDYYLDETQTKVIDRQTGFFLRVFGGTDKDLEANARRLARSDMLSAAIGKGIRKDATDQAHAVIGNYLRGLGYERVAFN